VFYHLVFRAQPPQPQEGEGVERTSAIVVGIEHIPALTALAEKNIRADRLGKAIDERNIMLVTGDGRLGAFAFSPTPSVLWSSSNTRPHVSENIFSGVM
jgi:hypothetical protein